MTSSKRPLIFYGAETYGSWGGGGKWGYFYRLCKQAGIKPLCFVDKDESKHGTKIDDVIVISPEKAKALYLDFDVFITSRSYSIQKEIYHEMLLTGFVSDESRIINRPCKNGEIFKNDFSPLLGSVQKLTSTPLSFCKRISDIYKKICSESKADGQWEHLNKLKSDIHKALLQGDAQLLSEMLSNPMSHNLMLGFANMTERFEPGNYEINLPEFLYKLGEIWGVMRFKEGPVTSEIIDHNAFLWLYNKGELIKRLEELFSCEIAFPNPYYGEFGIKINRGDGEEDCVASYIALQGLYQAFAIWDKLEHRSGRVLEIGAGLGYTAYYCKTLFSIDYTIIDLPLTQVASAHFLSQSLGQNAICLYGETSEENRIKILPPFSFLDDNLGKFDLILNANSLTEMDYPTMKAYWNKIKTTAHAFLSINHEFNEHTIRELVFKDPHVKTYSRNIYVMRDGYAEEYMTFND